MMASRLDDDAVRRLIELAKEGGSRFEVGDSECVGLMVRVTPGGVATWYLACKDNYGRSRKFLLGACAGMSRYQASVMCAGLREEVRQGSDPIADRKQARIEAIANRVVRVRVPKVEKVRVANKRNSVIEVGAVTYRHLMGMYEDVEGKGQRSWDRTRKRQHQLMSDMLDRPLVGITRKEWQLKFDRLKADKTGATSLWAYRTWRPIIVFGIARDLCPGDWLGAKVSSKGNHNVRQRYLKSAELSRLLGVLLARSGESHADIMRFILMSACRLSEVANMKWADVDFIGRTVTLPMTKNGKEHIIPLSRQAHGLLMGRFGSGKPVGEFVFSNGGRKALTDNWDRVRKMYHRETGVSDWHCHDLRRTASVCLGELGVAQAINDEVLNHAPAQLARTYNPAYKASLRGEVAKALQLLADHLDKISGGNVVRLVA